MKLENGDLTIDLEEIIQNMTEPQLRWLARTAVFQEELLRGVIDFLVEGIVWNGVDDCIDEENGVVYQPDNWWYQDEWALRMKEKLPKILSAAAAQMIHELDSERKFHEHCHKQYRNALWSLVRTWNDQGEHPRRGDVDITGGRRNAMTKEDAEKLVRELEEKLGQTQ